MKINDSNLNAVTSANSQAEVAKAAAAASARAGATHPRHGATGDAVHLSGLSSSLLALASGGPAHDAKVNQIAAVHQSGSYKVDSAAVSRQIVRDALKG